MSYNPFEDILAASTRNGSVLPMQLDSVGLLSKEAPSLENIAAEAAEDGRAAPDFSDCPYYLYSHIVEQRNHPVMVK